MAQLVMSAIPLELALAIPVTLNEENFEFDYSKVIPHLDSIMNDIVDRAKQLIELEKEEPDNSVL